MAGWGGKREGAGRKRSMYKRTPIPIHFDRRQLHRLNCLTDFIKETDDIGTMSTSKVVRDLTQQWMADVEKARKGEYRDWAERHKERIREEYPLEFARLWPDEALQKGKKLDGTKTEEGT